MANIFGSNKIFHFSQESDLLQKVQCCACQIRLRDYKLSPKRHTPNALFLKLFFMFFDADSACYIPGKEDRRLWIKGISLLHNPLFEFFCEII